MGSRVRCGWKECGANDTTFSMATLAKLSTRLNRAHRPFHTRAAAANISAQPSEIPCFFLFSDSMRLPDPGPYLARLPRGAAVVLRHQDPGQLEDLARRILPRARAFGLKVLIANDVRLALKCRADGVHLSEHHARRGPLRCSVQKPGFLITAAAHSVAALNCAARAGAMAIMVSPVYATKSHPTANTLGIIRFFALARISSMPVIALGGIEGFTLSRLKGGPQYGFGAIGYWTDPPRA